MARRPSPEAMARHELRYEGFRRTDKDSYELQLRWERDGECLGLVKAVVFGGRVWAYRNDGGDRERYKRALASWAVDEMRREAEAGRGRDESQDGAYVLNVDTRAVERLAASDDELPDLVEGEVVGSFET